jgi:uncharacterized protein
MTDPLRARFVNRERELAELRWLADSERPALVLLYGRRRVGKTYLLDQAWEGRRVFYFLAADTTPELNRSELLRELSIWTGQALDAADYPTWRTVFRLLATLAQEGPLVVVLDEFQYLMGQAEDIVSQLVAVWDREIRDRPLLLALCGSEVATMERLQAGDQPLYGRPNWAARLRSLDYRDSARMVPDRPLREVAYVYGIFGGTPRYLMAITPREPLGDSVARTVLSPRGEVHLQLETIVEQEKGIRDPADYRAVLASVARGMTEINGIAQASGLGERPHVVRRALGVLEGLELVRRERNFGAPEKAPYRYRIADNAVRFWYAFVHPNRSRLETGDPVDVWQQVVQPRLDTYMGIAFEHMCRTAFTRYHGRWGLSGARAWARWEGRDRNRRPIEIDMVAELDDGRLLTGEIKWSSSPVADDVYRRLRTNLEDLSRSGYAWAHHALSHARSGGHIFFSAAGFSDEFRRRADADERIHLLELTDLYPA